MISPSTVRCAPTVERFTLANGMRVAVLPEELTPLVALNVSYAAGSKAEPPSACGLAHVCEHVAGLAPPGASAQTYMEAIESCGGLANGSTSHERISFSAVLPSQRLSLGLRVEASRMSHPHGGLTDATLDAQRGVVVQEYGQRVGNRPYGRSFELVQRLLYPPTHPYHWPPGGLPERVAGVSRQEVETFLGANFTPDKATLILIGDVPSGAADEVERLFGALPAGAGEANGKPHGVVEQMFDPGRAAPHEVLEDRVPFTRVYVAFIVPGFGEQGWYAASLWLRSLAVGRTSSLQRKLVRERGVAQDVGAQLVTMRDASTAAFVATAAPGVGCGQLEESLRAALDELLAEGVSEARLARARKKALTDHFSSVQHIDRRAEFVAASIVFRDDPAHDVEEHYGRLSTADVSEFGLSSCRAEDCAVLSIVPRGGER
jgi:zinc protease